MGSNVILGGLDGVGLGGLGWANEMVSAWGSSLAQSGPQQSTSNVARSSSAIRLR